MYKPTAEAVGLTGRPEAVGQLSCDGLGDAICYTTEGGGGTCAEGWEETEEVRDCKWYK